jgi:hypothetical protein
MTIGSVMWSEYLRMICLQLPAAEELVLALAQVQDDVGAATGLLDHLDGEIALAAGFPA